MTAFSVQPPYPPFADADGAPLENGYIWLGSAGLDPQSNPVTAYFDAALTITAAQPIRTQGGYPVYQGTPARLYINGTNYSIRVMNKNGLTVYTALNTTEAWNGSVLADDSVTTAKLADNSVTTAKLAPNAVTAAKVERVAANQVLRSTGVSSDPAWGALDLTTDVTDVLPVANGGTGAATLAANNVLLGNGTSAVQEVAPGADGNVLTASSGTWASSAPPAKSLSVEVFAATTTWTAPAGVTQLRITAAGGGGGGGANNTGGNGGGGGFGGFASAIISVTPATVYEVTIGDGGVGTNTTGVDGTAGTETWFGVNSGSKLVSCTGGAGGVAATASLPGINGADGSSTVTGTVIRSGVYSLSALFGGAPTPASRRSSTTTALVWDVSSIFAPGTGGDGETSPSSNNAGGGLGGAIMIEYVG